MEEQSIEEKIKKLREIAKEKNWSSKKTSAFIDRMSEDELVRRGDTPVSEIKDPSRQLGFRKEGIEEEEKWDISGKDRFLIAEDYLDEIDEKIAEGDTKEEILKYLEGKKFIFDKAGVDSQMFLDAVERGYAGKEDVEVEKTGGAMGKAKDYFKRMFSKETLAKPPKERSFAEQFFRRPGVFG